MPGLEKLEENIRKLEAANEETRTVTREAHAVLKDLKAAIKEARTLLENEVEHSVALKINNVVQEAMDELGTALRTMMDNSVEHIIGEFQKLADSMMGLSEGKISLDEMAAWVRKKLKEKQELQLPGAEK